MFIFPHRKTAIALAICVFINLGCQAGNWNDEVGLQLESFNSKIGGDMAGTLEKVHRDGFKYVELVGDYHLSPAALIAELRSHDLTAFSAHFPYARFRDDPEGLAIEAEKLGLKFAGCPSLPQREDLDLAGCEKAIAIFNRAGEIMAKHHIVFFYHPHGYEFKPCGASNFFDLLVSRTSPDFVHFQMDVFWIVHAGQDPLKLFDQYGDRWVSMHLKDMKKGAATGSFSGHAERSAFVPIGQGQIHIAQVIQAAHKIGIKWFYIEDESAAQESGVIQSVKYLKTLPW